MNERGSSQRKPLPRLTPRWKLPGFELAGAGLTVRSAKAASDQRERANALHLIWQEEGTIENALSLVDAVAALDDKSIAISAAQQILRTPNVKKLARQMAASIFPAGDPDEKPLAQSAPTGLRSVVRANRERLADEPRNALLWAETAQAQTFLGANDAALKNFRIALALAPNDRFILRSFSRFAAHLSNLRSDNDPIEEALWNLRKADRIAFDPWVHAPEISLSDMLGQSPTSAKRAAKLLKDGDHSPLVLSEAASALGTLESSHGARGKATKLIAASLVNPNENSLSQAAWLAVEDRVTLSQELGRLGVTAFNEAAAYDAIRRSDWQTAVERTWDWQLDEPFSLSAPANGSFYSIAALYDGELALQFCREGLKLNPQSTLLQNNEAVAYCVANRPTEARLSFARLAAHNHKWVESPTYTATKGLVEIASGNLAEGRQYYARAIELADKTNDLDLKFRVRANWLLHESMRGLVSPDFASQIVRILDPVTSSKGVLASSRQLWPSVKDRVFVASTSAFKTSDQGLEDFDLKSVRLTDPIPWTTD